MLKKYFYVRFISLHIRNPRIIHVVENGKISFLLVAEFRSAQLLSPVDLIPNARLSCTSQTPGVCWTHVQQVTDAIQSSHPLSSPFPPAFNLSQHLGLFQVVSSLHQVAKVVELQLQHQSLQWMFRIDFFQDWLVCSPCCPWDSQGSSPAPQCKASILWLSTFSCRAFTSIYDYWKNHSFVSKVMSQLFNMLSRFVIAFSPRSKCFLISWLQSPSVVILESKKIKPVSFHCFLICLSWSDGTRYHDLCFLNVEF